MTFFSFEEVLTKEKGKFRQKKNKENIIFL